MDEYNDGQISVNRLWRSVDRFTVDSEERRFQCIANRDSVLFPYYFMYVVRVIFSIKFAISTKSFALYIKEYKTCNV